MTGGDFFGSEQSVIMPKADTVKIEHVSADGKVTVLKDGLKLQAGEV
jgi:isocitrate dehydrogenase